MQFVQILLDLLYSPSYLPPCEFWRFLTPILMKLEMTMFH
jgi:hypothetical protein